MSDARKEMLRQLLSKWTFAPAPNGEQWLDGGSLRRRIYLRWMAFARVLGRVNTMVLLTVFYFAILGPVALILRILRKDLLDRWFEDRSSYWYDREQEEHSLERRSRQF